MRRCVPSAIGAPPLHCISIAMRSPFFLSAMHSAPVSADEGHVLHPADPCAKAVGRVLHNSVLALLHRAHIDLDVAGAESIFGAAPCRVDCACACNEGLGGNAAVVDASAAEGFTF